VDQGGCQCQAYRGGRVATHLYGLEFMPRVGVGDGGVENACEREVVSTGEGCLEHQGGGKKERIEYGLKERREPGTVNALRAVHGRGRII